MRRKAISLRTLSLLAVLALAAGGCHSKPKQLSFAGQIAQAQGIEYWQSHTALEGDMRVEMKEPGATATRVLDAHFIYEPRTGRTKMRLDDPAVTLINDGQRIWVSPASSTYQQARVTLNTWPFFIAAPFMLERPGAQLGAVESKQLGQQTYNAVRLTWAPGTNPTPYDWSIVYVTPDKHMLQAMAYGPANDPSKAMAITYYDFRNTAGAVLPTDWKFWQWNKDIGIFGLPIGSGRIYNLEFTEPPKNTFQRPPDAREIP